MRERRHLSGNSNMPRPASARSDTGSSVSRSPVVPRTSAATARRPEPEQPPGNGVDENPGRRRIHSARVERPRSSHIVRSPIPEPEAGPGRAIVRSPPVLPHLALPTSSQVEWAVKVSTPEIAAAVAKPIVVKDDISSPIPVPAHLQPVLKDFSSLLRDRYEGKRSLRLAFLNWDRDKDGQLSLQEIRDMIHTLGLTKKLGHQNVEAIIDHVSNMPSQSLKYNDFCGYVYSNRGEVTTDKPMNQEVQQTTAKQPAQMNQASPEEDDIVLSSDRALYPDPDRVVNILRKKYETKQLRQVFRHWDTDKDGCVTLQELDGNLRRQGVKLPRSQLRELFDKHDANKDGRLTYHEFVEMVCGPVTTEHHNPALQAHLRELAKQQNQQLDPYQIMKNSVLNSPQRRLDEEEICTAVQEKLKVFAPRIHEAYTAFDDDHNGNLSYAEFRQGLDILGLPLSQREFVHLASIVDTDGSGEISFREFSNLFNRKHKPRPTDASAHISDPKGCEPQVLEKQRDRLSKGTFDFSHLTRRTKAPTRHGRTPYPNTKDLLSPTSQEGTTQPYQTETSLYGSGQVPRSHRHTTPTTSTPTYTIGQEEKQRKDANYAKRLARIRSLHHDYVQHTAPLNDEYETMQLRRIETLHRHQQRYQASVEDHRPHPPRYAPQVAQRARQPTVAPYLHQ